MLYSKKIAVCHGNREYDYQTLAERILRLGNSLLCDFHVCPGDRIAILCQNIPAFLEAMYAIPSVGGVLVPLNARLAPPELEYMIRHSGTTVLIVQDELLPRVSSGVKEIVKMIQVNDYCLSHASDNDAFCCQYENLVQKTEVRYLWNDMPLTTDENALLSINYTSGSTGSLSHLFFL